MSGSAEEMPTEPNCAERVELEEKGYLTRINEYKPGFRDGQDREHQVLSSLLWLRRGIQGSAVGKANFLNLTLILPAVKNLIEFEENR